jgi:hypothetical protein
MAEYMARLMFLSQSWTYFNGEAAAVGLQFSYQAKLISSSLLSLIRFSPDHYFVLQFCLVKRRKCRRQESGYGTTMKTVGILSWLLAAEMAMTNETMSPIRLQGRRNPYAADEVAKRHWIGDNILDAVKLRIMHGVHDDMWIRAFFCLSFEKKFGTSHKFYNTSVD